VLAVATRTYFSAQLRASIEDAAAEAALVAQRLVEDYAAIEQRSGAALNLIDDEVMVLVSRALDQDVNLFARGLLQASSERDLFASGLLSRRTPGEVYLGIAIDRLPTYVGREQVGGVAYLLAAAPVHAGGQDGIVTVPLTLRQQETERLIDEVDRRIVAASVLFVIVGAALGYWMAERIADPVRQLSRATRRIASGDLDARVAAESADEIGRLVRDFNRMAADLTRQRTELERSKRLEAWAEVARQVAHDIKNPLTPIQLAAEHARRVNLDRGAPLSPALDTCVSTILGQVALLRQLASEFSSFASTPTARPESTALGELVREVVEPYRMGLSGRVEIGVSVEDGLPRVSVDRRLLSRALTNIIENALHAMSGRGTLRIDVAGAATPAAITAPEFAESPGSSAPRVRLRVADSGVGMDEDALRRIFEPYFSTKTSGTGLGLTIAKRNVELNGGTISVESTLGVGTTVTVTLPAAVVTVGTTD
jgi:two-component system nitrogen regulation sensor histidine kinase NtrY